MRFLPTLFKGRSAEVKQVSAKAPTSVTSIAMTPRWGSGNQPITSNWDLERAITVGLTQTTWSFKCILAIASAQAKLPWVARRDHPLTGTVVTNNPVVRLMNSNPNPYEDAFSFRFRLSATLLLSKMGAFVEVQRTKGGDPYAFFLLPPDATKPIPDPKTFISGFEVTIGAKKEFKEVENVLWLKMPHPTDPYSGLTPMEACGLAVDTDMLAKMYNRNFLLNDGRPGGILAIKDEIDEEDEEVLQRRFLGSGGAGPSGAGRVTVLQTGEEGVDWVDTAITPRDAQFIESRKQAKEEVLIAFGVGESVIGNASGRTFDNADAEYEVFWRDTMSTHNTLVSNPFNRLDNDSNLFHGFDLSGISVLDRDNRNRASFALDEVKMGVKTDDEYREITGQKPFGSDRRFIPTAFTQLERDGSPVEGMQPAVPGGAVPGATVPTEQVDQPQEGGQPPKPQAAGGDEGDNQGEGQPAALRVAAAHPAGRKDADVDVETNAVVTWGKWRIPQTNLVEIKKRADRKKAAWERTVEKQMATFFKRQERVIVAKVQSRKSSTRLMETKQARADDFYDEATWDEQLADDSEGWITGVMDDFGGAVADDLDGDFDMAARPVKAAVKKQKSRVLLVNRTTKVALDDAFDRWETYEDMDPEDIPADEAEHGTGVEGLVSRVAAVFATAVAVRALSVAISEVTTAANTAAVLAGQQNGAQTKTWTTVGDSRVRDWHDEADGQTVDVDEPFDVGPDKLMYPGDPDADPENVINCRCWVVMGTPEGAIGAEQEPIEVAATASAAEAKIVRLDDHRDFASMLMAGVSTSSGG